MNSSPQLVHEFIVHRFWSITLDLQIQIPLLKNLMQQVTISISAHDGRLVWTHTTSGKLPSKEAFHFKKQHQLKIPWTKCISNRDIRPSKATLVWRVMLGKLPTDDILAQRGCYFPSNCSLCQTCAETSLHLFFDYSYSLKIWNWLAATLDTPLHFQSLEDIWKLANRFSNKQCKVVVNAALIFTINVIWYATNQLRFITSKFPGKAQSL